MKQRLCDKCGFPVSVENDALRISAIVSNSGPIVFLLYSSRHFKPVENSNGEIICEGSPSRFVRITAGTEDRVLDMKYKMAYLMINAKNKWGMWFKLFKASFIVGLRYWLQVNPRNMWIK